MKTKKINGTHFEKMLQNGLANLCRFEEELNSLNVFPVADGDTGSNMRATLAYGLREAASAPAAGAYLKSLSEAMLFGAHGNSGVILSQLFRGIYLALSRCGNVNPGELRNAFIMGYKTAYSAVVRPVEGTILTVAREGIENIRNQIDRGSTFEDLLSMYVAEMRKSLARTPDILPQLKDAGVVDSGALGYIILVEGMLGYLFGDIIPSDEIPKKEKLMPETTPGEALFNEYSMFEDGYCVEFVLQLMKSGQYSQHFSLSRYIADLKDFGNSIVAVQSDSRVKVHIHTFKPGKILWLSQEYGEFVSCKVENMQIQHNATIPEAEAAKERKAFSVISVCDCAATQELFSDLGSSSVICGGSKMDVSVQDFINALNTENAQTTVILPDNPNLLHVAKQAKELFREGDVVILETKTIPEGYCALAMSNPDETDIDRRIRQMQSGFEGIHTLSAAIASRAYHTDQVECLPGMRIAVLDGEVVSAGDEDVQVLCEGLKQIPDIREKESCIIFRGENSSEAMEPLLEERIRSLFPDLEISFLYCGSQLYLWSAAIS